MTNNSPRRPTFLFTRVSAAVLLVGLFTPSAFAQGLFVKPMRVDVVLRPNTTGNLEMQVRNTSDRPQTVGFELLHLTQSASGSWTTIDPASDVDTSKLASCRDWLTLTQEPIALDPLETVSPTLTIKVPSNARGYYFAALLLKQIRDTSTPGQMAININFLIPVIIEIQGRPVRQQIELVDVAMTRVEASDRAPASTTAALRVDNLGRTYSRVTGQIEIQYQRDGRWLPVARVEPKSTGIIPGVSLWPSVDLERRLPSGKYRMKASVSVDGRRLRPFEKEFDFEGDPSVTRLAADSALVLDSRQLSISGVAGATRTAVLTIENGSEDTVEIEAAAVIPKTLQGVAIGELRGDQLGCADWVRISPERIRLRGGGKQNVRLVARIPREEQLFPNYYATLVLKATYPDGQSAGETEALVHVSTASEPTPPQAAAVKLGLAGSEESKYILQSQFANVGLTHFAPKVEARVVNTIGQSLLTARLDGETTTMLPMAVRDFAGEIDFKSIPPGLYVVRVTLQHGEGASTSKELPIEVSEGEVAGEGETAGLKVVTIIEAAQPVAAESDEAAETGAEATAAGDE